MSGKLDDTRHALFYDKHLKQYLIQYHQWFFDTFKNKVAHLKAPLSEDDLALCIDLKRAIKYIRLSRTVLEDVGPGSNLFAIPFNMATIRMRKSPESSHIIYMTIADKSPNRRANIVKSMKFKGDRYNTTLKWVNARLDEGLRYFDLLKKYNRSDEGIVNIEHLVMKADPEHHRLYIETPGKKQFSKSI